MVGDIDAIPSRLGRVLGCFQEFAVRLPGAGGPVQGQSVVGTTTGCGPAGGGLSAASKCPVDVTDIAASGVDGVDLTVFAPGGNDTARVAWIVVEAKDERGAASTPAGRAALFTAKAKYITADTAWMVMVDPDMFVARPAQRGNLAITDIEVPFAELTIEAFADELAALAADVAGVPVMLQRFRDGDETLIATDRLTGEVGDPDEELAVAIARNTFFDVLTETTQLLQRSVRDALGTVPIKGIPFTGEM